MLVEQPDLQNIVHEVHPELSFWAWNGHSPIIIPKRNEQGMLQRRKLVDSFFGGVAFESVRKSYDVMDVADDDINDAFAALWTAERIVRGEAQRIPASPGIDSCGLRIEMWY